MKPELIEKFFRKECTPEEAKKIALYLQSHPEILEKYMSIEEWKLTGRQLMPADFWNKSWAVIQKKINKEMFLLH